MNILRFGRHGVVILLAGMVVVAARGENRPQWRGPGNDGISNERGLPTTWSDTSNIAWKLAMPGPSGATPVVWGDRIFLTSEDSDKNIVLMCVNTAGKELWRQRLGSGARHFMRDEGTSSSASPSTDGTHVYAFCG